MPERVLSPVLCGHFCTHCKTGIIKNPRENMHTKHRGFIPMVAVILLGLVAVAGGTIATISIRSADNEVSGVEQQEVAQEAMTTSDAEITTEDNTTSVETKADAIALPIQMAAPAVSVWAEETCAEAKDVPLPSPKASDDEVDGQTAELMDQQALARNSLIGQVHMLCVEIEGGISNEEELRETEQALKEKWTLWLKVNSRSR